MGSTFPLGYGASPVERVDAQVTSNLEPEVPSLAPLEASGTRLSQLVRAAREPGQAGAQSLSQLTKALGVLPASEENARALLALLEADELAAFRAEDGSQTRVLAVEALLRMGWPFALQIHPADLAWYRAQRSAAVRRRLLVWLVTFAAAAGAGAGLWASVGHHLLR